VKSIAKQALEDRQDVLIALGRELPALKNADASSPGFAEQVEAYLIALGRAGAAPSERWLWTVWWRVKPRP
jgi:hypothetical protein